MSNPLASAHDHNDGVDGSESEEQYSSNEDTRVDIHDDDDEEDYNTSGDNNSNSSTDNEYSDADERKLPSSKRDTNIPTTVSKSSTTTTATASGTIAITKKKDKDDESSLRKRKAASSSSSSSSNVARTIKKGTRSSKDELLHTKLDELHFTEKVSKSLDIPASSRYWNRPKLFFLGIMLWTLSSQLLFDISDHMGYMISLAVYIPLLVLIVVYIFYDRFQFMRREQAEAKDHAKSSSRRSNKDNKKNTSKTVTAIANIEKPGIKYRSSSSHNSRAYGYSG